MKVYMARFVLHNQWKDGLVGIFDFEQEREGNYKKTEYGYFRNDGWLSDRLEDEVDAYNSLCCVISIKYFDRELSKDELKQLERLMKLECIEALVKKKKVTVANLDKQIDYIQRQLEE